MIHRFKSYDTPVLVSALIERRGDAALAAFQRRHFEGCELSAFGEEYLRMHFILARSLPMALSHGALPNSCCIE